MFYDCASDAPAAVRRPAHRVSRTANPLRFRPVSFDKECSSDLLEPFGHSLDHFRGQRDVA